MSDSNQSEKLGDIKDRTPNPGLVTLLERLLQEAKDGEIRTLFYITAFNDDAVTHGWAIDWRTTMRKVLAEAVMMQHNMVVNIEMKEQDSVLYEAIND